MNGPFIVEARVPGKVMLAGEYAVLDGGDALAVTVDRYLTVHLRQAAGAGGCRVSSELWPGERFVPVGAEFTDYKDEPLLAVVAHAMEAHRLSDVMVMVSSELNVSYGIGSSSALRLAVLLAFDEWARLTSPLRSRASKPAADWAAARAALFLQRYAQQQASGYDLAVQLSGGLVLVQTGEDLATWPRHLRRIPAGVLPALQELTHVFVGGQGAPTAPLLTSTMAWLKEQALLPSLKTATIKLQAAFAAAVSAPAKASEIFKLTAACGRHRQLFSMAPGFPTQVAAALTPLPGRDEAWSFKTTGAGGEDAVLLLGPREAVAAPAHRLAELGWHRLEAAFTPHGAQVIHMREHSVG